MTPLAKLTTPETPDTKRWTVVALLVVGVAVNYVDRGNLSVAAPQVMHDLAIQPAAMGALLSSFFWSYSLLQLPGGWLLDRFGLKRTYACAFVVWSLASAAIGFAQTFEQILIMRLVLGAGECVVTPASMAYIRRNFADHEQGLPTSILVGGMMLGPAIGTLIGGFLLDVVGWRALFISTGLVACLWLIPWLAVVREQPAVATSPVYGHISLGLLLRNHMFWSVSGAALLYSYFWYFCLNWLPSYLVVVRKLSPSQMAVATAAPLVLMAAAAAVAARLADRLIRGNRRALVVRAAFAAAGFCGGSVLLFLPVVSSGVRAAVVLSLSLISVGFGSANYWAFTQAAVPRHLIGRAIAYQNTLGNLGGVTAPLLSGILIDATNSFFASIWIAAAAILLAGLFYAVLLANRSSLSPMEFE